MEDAKQTNQDPNEITNIDKTKIEKNKLNNNSIGISGINAEYPTLLDKIICEYGYRLELWKIMICISLIYAVDGYSGTIFATMITAYTKYFNLSDSDISLIGITYFIIKAIAAFFAGHLTKLFNGRVMLINVSCFVMLITNLLLSLHLTKEMLWVERILSGIAAGFVEPLMNNLLCEYLPIKLRGFTLLSVWTGYNVGQLYPNLIMMKTMPKYETTGISKTLLLSTSLMVICSIFSIIFLKDSPRNYIVHGREEEGFEILAKLTSGGKLSEDDKKLILKESREGVNKDISTSSSWDVFKGEFLIITICVCALSLISDLLYDGPVLIMNLTLTSVNGEGAEDNVLSSAIIVILFAIPSSIIGGISFEIKFFGRRRTMFFSFIFLIISLILTILLPQYIYIFLGIYQFFANYCAVMAAIYASEVFPTRIRDFSVGLSVFFSNFGSALSQYVFIALHSHGPFTPYYFSIACCVVGCVFCCLLTVETFERPLDMDNPDKLTKNENDLNAEDNHNAGYEERVKLLNKSD